MLFFLLTVLLTPPYPTTVDALRSADEAANSTVDRGSAHALLEALAALTKHPARVAGDPATQRLQTLAQLNLARTYVLLGKQHLARATIDEAIRTAHGAELPAAAFGPTLERLYAERAATLEQAGHARLRVSCSIPCTVYVDERETPPVSEPLVLGIYRVWVSDASGQHPPLHEFIWFDAPGQVVELRYEPTPRVTAGPDRLLPPPRPDRVLSRKTEVVLLLVGIAAAGIGAGVYVAGQRTLGPVVIGLGGLGFSLGGALLIFDELRSRPTSVSPSPVR